VKAIAESGVDDLAIFTDMADYLPAFKRLIVPLHAISGNGIHIICGNGEKGSGQNVRKIRLIFRL
jgi:hypothetical protein